MKLANPDCKENWYKTDESVNTNLIFVSFVSEYVNYNALETFVFENKMQAKQD